MREGWMRAAVLAAVLVVLALYTFFRGAPERSTVDQLEQRLRDFPIQAVGDTPRPVGEYARHYAEARPRTWDELGFTTPPPAGTPAPGGKAVIAGVLVQPGDKETGRPGIRRVRANQLPMVEDGGCTVVNVVYDPKKDDILAAWCNSRSDTAKPAH